MFKNRHDAATQLASKLEKYRNTNGIVLAIPRGGVPIGFEIAKKLGLPLEIVLSKKIGHPRNPEFAIGSVSLNGATFDANVMDVSKEYINNEGGRILLELKEKFKLFMGNRKPTDLKNKTVVIVDDGIATGNTILATVDAVKKSMPKEIIIAVPVAPVSVSRKIAEKVNDYVCLEKTDDFMAVGQFYDDFSQVSDQEVIKFLRDAAKTSAVA